MPKTILILAEGFTEDIFIKRILNPYYSSREISFISTIIKTKRVYSGTDYKGGISSYSQVKNDLIQLCKDTSASYVTTMIDYYAIPHSFPGFKERPSSNCYKRVEFIEEKFGEDINRNNFVPYLQLHEFEALVFAAAENLNSVFINETKRINKIIQVNSNFKSPEEINENFESTPSRRLKNIFPEYQKEAHAYLTLANYKVDELRKKCQHFNAWLTRLEC